MCHHYFKIVKQQPFITIIGLHEFKGIFISFVNPPPLPSPKDKKLACSEFALGQELYSFSRSKLM